MAYAHFTLKIDRRSNLFIEALRVPTPLLCVSYQLSY